MNYIRICASVHLSSFSSIIHSSIHMFILTTWKRSTWSCRKQFVERYVANVITLYIFITSLVHGLSQKDAGRDSSSRIAQCSKSFLLVRNGVAASLHAITSITSHLRKPFIHSVGAQFWGIPIWKSTGLTTVTPTEWSNSRIGRAKALACECSNKADQMKYVQ